MPDRQFDIAIIGGGPAGLAAGLYAGRLRERAVLFEAKGLGGQLLNTELIEDYPGQLSILGLDLAAIMAEQATRFGVEVVPAEVLSIALMPDGQKLITTEIGEFLAPAVIITAGGTPRRLGIPGETEFAGRGVSYCAVCDGAFFVGTHVAVAGGGDAAIEEALFLTRYAEKVTIIHRRQQFTAQPILLNQAKSHPQIDFLPATIIEAVSGAAKISHLTLRDLGSDQTYPYPVGGLFVFIGFIPNATLVEAHLDHDAGGYYLTNPYTLMTSIPGIFAAGDVRAQLTRQITTAVGDATTATLAASQWLAEWRRPPSPKPL